MPNMPAHSKAASKSKPPIILFCNALKLKEAQEEAQRNKQAPCLQSPSPSPTLRDLKAQAIRLGKLKSEIKSLWTKVAGLERQKRELQAKIDEATLTTEDVIVVDTKRPRGEPSPVARLAEKLKGLSENKKRQLVELLREEVIE